MSDKFKVFLARLSFMVALGGLVAFAYFLLAHNVELNMASWGGWFIVDLLVFASAWKAGKWEWQVFGYAVGAFLVMAILTTKGNWSWSWVETAAVIGCAISMLVWMGLGSEKAFIASTIASLILSVPTVKDAWLHPDFSVAWFWGLCALSAALSLSSTKKWTMLDRFYPVTNVIFNGSMLLLHLR